MALKIQADAFVKSELEARGIKCLTPEISELKKGGGYIRCISLWLS